MDTLLLLLPVIFTAFLGGCLAGYFFGEYRKRRAEEVYLANLAERMKRLGQALDQAADRLGITKEGVWVRMLARIVNTAVINPDPRKLAENFEKNVANELSQRHDLRPFLNQP